MSNLPIPVIPDYASSCITCGRVFSGARTADCNRCGSGSFVTFIGGGRRRAETTWGAFRYDAMKREAAYIARTTGQDGLGL